MADIITVQELQDASLDVQALERFINGDDTQDVLTRLSKRYPTLQKALKRVSTKIDEANNQLQKNLDNADQALVAAKVQLEIAIDDLFKNGGLPATPFKTVEEMRSSDLVLGSYAYVTDDTNLNNGLYIKEQTGWVRSTYDIAELLDQESERIKEYAISDILGELTKTTPPKEGVYADFVNGVYGRYGVPCEFEDLFEVKRSTEAWTRTEKGIVSYKPNTPRFSEGLLIEPSIENKLTQNDILEKFKNTAFIAQRVLSGFNSEVRITYKPGDGLFHEGSSIVGVTKKDVLGTTSDWSLRSVTVKRGDSRYVILGAGDSVFVVFDVFNNLVAYKKPTTLKPQINVQGQWATLSFMHNMTGVNDNDFTLLFGSSYLGNGSVRTKNYDALSVVNAVFSKTYHHSTQPILAINTPYTKTGDSLVFKEAVQYVEGDWDSNVSVKNVDNKLVVSGIGTIRKLHLNKASFNWRSQAVAFWDFKEKEAPYRATHGREEFPLKDGNLKTHTVEAGPFGRSLVTGNQKYLIIPNTEVGALNVATRGNEVTVVAWIYRESSDIEFIAGMWQEDNNDPRRQYGLFVHLPLYDGSQQVCGHVSKSGGPTPGYPYAIEYSASLRTVPQRVWQTIGFTYDGQQIISYLQGYADQRPVKNPLFFSDGLNTANVSDFTVGGTRLTNGMTHFMDGMIGGVAVFDRALNAHEMMEIHRTTLGQSSLVWSIPPNVFSDKNKSLEESAGGKSYTGSKALRTALTVLLDESTPFYKRWGYPVITTVLNGAGYLFTRGTEVNVPYQDPKVGVLPVPDGIAFSTVTRMEAVIGNQFLGYPVYLVVIVDGVWYVHSEGLSNKVAMPSSADWTNSETLSVTTKGLVWNIMTVIEDEELSVGDTLVKVPEDGYVEYVGFYVAKTQGHIRVRDIRMLSS